MDTPSPATLFMMWERGRHLAPSSRSWVMLRALGFDDSTLGQLTIGQRDAILMDLRAGVFGGAIASVADCPSCGDRLDITFQLADVWVTPPDAPTGPIAIEHGGFTIHTRPPRLDDLVWLEREGRDIEPRTALLGRCVLDARHASEHVDVACLPDEIVDRISSTLAEADPQADVRLALGCAACGHEWTTNFDIVSFFWQELDAWVWRMARDVDALAARYGWSEAEILAMGPDRRSLYLEVARA